MSGQPKEDYANRPRLVAADFAPDVTASPPKPLPADEPDITFEQWLAEREAAGCPEGATP